MFKKQDDQPKKKKGCLRKLLSIAVGAIVALVVLGWLLDDGTDYISEEQIAASNSEEEVSFDDFLGSLFDWYGYIPDDYDQYYEDYDGFYDGNWNPEEYDLDDSYNPDWASYYYDDYGYGYEGESSDYDYDYYDDYYGYGYGDDYYGYDDDGGYGYGYDYGATESDYDSYYNNYDDDDDYGSYGDSDSSNTESSTTTQNDSVSPLAPKGGKAPKTFDNSNTPTRKLITKADFEKTNTDKRTSSEKRNLFINCAKAYMGTPYVLGGESKSGIDCSGLIYMAAQQAGLGKLPRTAKTQYSITQKISDSQREPGDLIFFQADSKISHVAIYLGDNQVLHSISDGPKTGVVTSKLSEKYWKQHYYGAGRIFED